MFQNAVHPQNYELRTQNPLQRDGGMLANALKLLSRQSKRVGMSITQRLKAWRSSDPAGSSAP